MKRVLLCVVALSLSACATSFKPKAPAVLGASPFSFVLTPEECALLKKERRTYRATGEALLYAAGAGAVVTGLALAFTDPKTAPAIGVGVTAAATGGAKFTSSQVADLDEELAAGGCPR